MVYAPQSVIHGSLVSPYSSADEDKFLFDLAHLFHALTRRLSPCGCQG